MGAGQSSPYLDASWQNQVSGDWRSAKARELDKLGGANREAVKRGSSMKMRLEWLQNALVEQEQEIEDALAKDPMAGRHEIIAQEVKKATKDGSLPPPNKARFSVKQWMQMDHTALRAMERAEAVKRQAQDRQAAAAAGANKTPPGARSPVGGWGPPGSAPAGGTSLSGAPVDGGPQWNNLHWARGQMEFDAKAAVRERMRDYYLNMEVTKKKGGDKEKQIRSAYATKGGKGKESLHSQDLKQYSTWRQNVFHAKKTAWRALSMMFALQKPVLRRHKRQRVARLDSFSFFIANNLGADLQRFGEEAHKLAGHKAAVRAAQQLLDELHTKARQAVARISMAGNKSMAARSRRQSHAGTHAAPSGAVTPHRLSSAQVPLDDGPLRGAGPSAGSTTGGGAVRGSGGGAGSAYAPPASAPSRDQRANPMMGTSFASPMRDRKAGAGSHLTQAHAAHGTPPGSPKLAASSGATLKAGGSQSVDLQNAISAPIPAGGTSGHSTTGGTSPLKPASSLPMGGTSGPTRPGTVGGPRPPSQSPMAGQHRRPGTVAGGPRSVLKPGGVSAGVAAAYGQLGPHLGLTPPPMTPSALANGGGPSPQALMRALTKKAVRGPGNTRVSIVSKDIVLGMGELEAMKEAALVKQIAEESTAAERPSRMLTMYVNRCNARWSEAQSWEPPKVYDVSRLAADARGGEADVFKSEVINALRAGKVAVQVFCGEDAVRLSSAHAPYDIWALDPWEVIGMALPGKASVADKLPGVPLGPRLLMALATAVDSVAGEGAAKKLRVLLHCHDGQEDVILQDLVARKHFGLVPENVLVLSQQRKPGYMWDPEQQRFIRHPGSHHTLAGTGYSMLQLLWEGEAEWVDAGGEAHQLQGSAAAYLKAAGVTWLVSRRLRDLSLYDPASTLDLDSLAYTMYLHESQGANMSVVVDLISSLKQDAPGIILGHKNHATSRTSQSLLPARSNSQGNTPAAFGGGTGHSSLTPAPSGLAGAGPSHGAARTSSSHIPHTPPHGDHSPGHTHGHVGGHVTPSHDHHAGHSPTHGSHAHGSSTPHDLTMYQHDPHHAGHHHPHGHHAPHGDAAAATMTASPFAAKPRALGAHVTGEAQAVVDIKVSELQTPRMAQLLADMKLKSKGKLAASTRRFCWHLDSLMAIAGMGVASFHVALETHGELSYVALDAADLTAAHAARCVALTNPAIGNRTVAGHADIDELMSVVSTQDKSSAFRKLLGETLPASGPKANGPLNPRPSGPGVAGEGAGDHKQEEKEDVEAKKAKSYSGNRVVVLVSDNAATQIAIQLLMAVLKPGKDLVMLITIVAGGAGSAAIQAGRALLQKYEEQVRTALVTTACEVLPKTGPLVEQVEEYVVANKADLVVMGSMALGGPSNQVMGSVAMTLVRSLQQPILVIKSTAKNADIAWGKDKLKAMVVVDHASRPLLRYTASKILNAVRGDKLYLARPQGLEKGSGAQETVVSRRILENYAEIAAGLHISAIKRPLDGSYEDAGVKAADAEKVHIMALQLPPGRNTALPESVGRLVANTRSAVLFYRSNETS